MKSMTNERKQLDARERYAQCQYPPVTGSSAGQSEQSREYQAALDLERRVKTGPKLRVTVSRAHEGQMHQPVILAVLIGGPKCFYVELSWCDDGPQDAPVCGVFANSFAAERWLQERHVNGATVGAA